MGDPLFSGSTTFEDPANGEVWLMVRGFTDQIAVGFTFPPTDFELYLTNEAAQAIASALAGGPAQQFSVATDQEDLGPVQLTAHGHHLDVRLSETWNEHFDLGEHAPAVADLIRLSLDTTTR